MLKLKITWPLLFLLLFALLAWLIRASAPPVAQPQPKRSTPRPARSRAAEPGMPRRHRARPMTINMPPAGADGADDQAADHATDRAAAFDAETARLDQAAMEAATESVSHHSSEPFVMPQGAWQQ